MLLTKNFLMKRNKLNDSINIELMILTFVEDFIKI